jgi:hypothetical protein
MLSQSYASGGALVIDDSQMNQLDTNTFNSNSIYSVSGQDPIKSYGASTPLPTTENSRSELSGIGGYYRSMHSIHSCQLHAEQSTSNQQLPDKTNEQISK